MSLHRAFVALLALGLLLVTVVVLVNTAGVGALYAIPPVLAAIAGVIRAVVGG